MEGEGTEGSEERMKVMTFWGPVLVVARHVQMIKKKDAIKLKAMKRFYVWRGHHSKQRFPVSKSIVAIKMNLVCHSYPQCHKPA